MAGRAATRLGDPVGPNGTIGILGGGQLGRMLAMAAARLGLKTHIYTDEADCPAADCAAAVTVGAYEDETALAAFGAKVDAVTYEFENVPARTVEILMNAGLAAAPGPRALAVAQDRLAEKTFVQELGAETAPFAAVDDLASLHKALAEVGRPAILKTRRFGYDGKGQARLAASADPQGTDVSAAWTAVREAPSILEGYVNFDCEISIVGARARTGDTALYDAARNDHRDGILRVSTVPADAPAQAIEEARRIATAMLDALDYVGVLAVEFFVTKEGGVLVNEFAPRVHNSGHWTIDACACSQFEQHIRAVAGWPLGGAARFADAVMENLIGDDAERWKALAAAPATATHLYGKADARPGRKMGHATRLLPLSANV